MGANNITSEIATQIFECLCDIISDVVETESEYKIKRGCDKR